jgi:CHAD domain-containing protein
MREFFGVTARSKVLSDAQELLGKLNDRRIAHELLHSLLDRLPQHAAELSFMEGLLAGRQEHALPEAVRFTRRKL